MEINLIKKELPQNQIIFEGETELGLETDIILPEWCPDIERLLKCSVLPKITSKRFDSARLCLGGSGVLRLCYLSKEGTIKNFETPVSFSKNIEVRGADRNSTADVKVNCEYVNCQMISGRRIEMRAALSLKILVLGLFNQSFVENIEGKGIETRKQTHKIIVPVCSVSDEFVTNEEYTVSEESVSSIVKINSGAKILETKIVSGKCIVKGEIYLTVFYLDNNGNLKTSDFTLPVNRMITAQGAEEGDFCGCNLALSLVTAEPTGRNLNNEVAVEIVGRISLDVNRETEISPVTDCYSTLFEGVCPKTAMTVTSLCSSASKNVAVKIKLPCEGGEILQCFADIKGYSCNINNEGEIMVSLSLLASAIVKNENGVSVCENTKQEEISLAAQKEFLGAHCNLSVSPVSVAPSGNDEVTVQIMLSADLRKSKTVSVVDGIELDEGSPVKRDRQTAVIMYFAKENEDVFEIAKNYKVSANEIMEQNALKSFNIPSPCPLIIPNL